MGVDVVATGVSLAGAGGVKVVRADRDFFLANSSAKLVYLLGLLPYNKVTRQLLHCQPSFARVAPIPRPEIGCPGARFPTCGRGAGGEGLHPQNLVDSVLCI